MLMIASDYLISFKIATETNIHLKVKRIKNCLNRKSTRACYIWWGWFVFVGFFSFKGETNMGFFTLDLFLFLNSINYTGMLKWFIS